MISIDVAETGTPDTVLATMLFRISDTTATWVLMAHTNSSIQ